MKFHLIRNAILSLVFLLPVTVTVLAGEPTERIRKTTDKLIAIVTDPELTAPERDTERRKLIRDAVNEIFDWEAFSRRAMGKYWRQRTGEEKREFIHLFGKLLERTYIDKTRQYSGEKVIFLDEKIDDDYGIVETRVVTGGGREVTVIYRVRKRESGWFVYDIHVEGVSLVNNYRVQFNHIMIESSYEDLVKKLREKVEQD